MNMGQIKIIDLKKQGRECSTLINTHPTKKTLLMHIHNAGTCVYIMHGITHTHAMATHKCRFASVEAVLNNMTLHKNELSKFGLVWFWSYCLLNLDTAILT